MATQLEQSLKGKNYKYLAAFGLFNVLVEYLVLFQATINAEELERAAKSAFVLAIVTMATMALDGLLDSQTKARLVFRKWRHPLPGSEAFSKHMLSDPRFDGAVIAQRYSPLPIDPDEQNKLWYKIYRRHREKAHILESLGRFMLMRDAAVMALMLAFVVGSIAWLDAVKPVVGLGAVAIVLAEYIIAAKAAKTFAIALVTNVLADEAMVQVTP